MAGSRATGVKSRERPQAETKQIILDQIAAGQTVENALIVAGRSMASYESYRKNDAEFRARVDRARLDAASAMMLDREGGFPPFHVFSESYLNTRVFPHIQNAIDLIEGRDPAWLHPAMAFERNEQDLVIVNMPPAHGKSTSLTVNYTVARIAEDPNIRILIVSKTAAMAQKFLMAVKDRLTHPKFAKFHATFGPPQGYSENSSAWTQKMIYVSADIRDSGEKDPTVEALGIGGHIYGARADIIIIDDAVDLENAHDYEKHITWIQDEVLNRIAVGGCCIVVGTRLASKDMYIELRNPKRYPDDENPWTYLSMPAVLEFADDPKDWVTLWPRSDSHDSNAKGDQREPDADGLFPRWDGPNLAKRRRRTSVDGWARVYQQQQTSDDQVFTGDMIVGVTNGQRRPGLIPNGMVGNRRGGMEGLIVVAGMDPAMVGFTSSVCVGIDPNTQKRYLLDVWNKAKMTPDAIREHIKTWTLKYGIVEWRVEKNAFQGMLTQDREIREFLSARGVLFREHHTGGYNKWNADFGVASLSTLFSGHEDKKALVEFPQIATESLKALVEQLVTWHPDAPKSQKTDTVMAWWICELAVRDRLKGMGHSKNTHVTNPFATRHDLSQRGSFSFLSGQAERFLSSV